MNNNKYPKSVVNYQPLTPLSFLYRTASIFPDKIAWIYNKRKANYKELLEKSVFLSMYLKKIGIKKNDVVSVMLPNVPEMIEAHFGVPMTGAILNSINTRLEFKSISYIIKHSKTKVFIFHEDYIDLIKKIIKVYKTNISYILVSDDEKNFKRIGIKILINYTNIFKNLKKSESVKKYYFPNDEWDNLSLNYTSGTTGNPKGVLYHHRGGYLMCLNNQMVWKMGYHPIYLWTLPMFHCNGWCFPWTIVALAGTQVCLKNVTGKEILKKFKKNNISHLCGAPIILQMIIDELKNFKLKHKVNIMTAASPPPPSILEQIEKKGFSITHVYGLTESYGPAVICEWKEKWQNIKSGKKRAYLKSRQGVKYPSLEFLEVMDRKKMKSVNRDGKTIGEVMFRGNIVMKGYLNNKDANKEAFKNGWFHTGDLAVVHSDGYIELKDRAKDIIISGGENISSIEVEKTIIQHKSVLDCAVIGIKNNKWGEVPCAFLELKIKNVTEKNILSFCKKKLAGFKVPKKIIFQKLPRTSTGKIKKFDLRKIAESHIEKV